MIESMPSKNKRKRMMQALRKWKAHHPNSTPEEKQIFTTAFRMGWNYRGRFGERGSKPRTPYKKWIKRQIKDDLKDD
jgi:hypothetical protein